MASSNIVLLLIFSTFVAARNVALNSKPLRPSNNSFSGSRLGGIEYEYFERIYAPESFLPFSPTPILNSHVESSVLESVINKQWRYIPLSISVYTVNYPRPHVYFNIFWGINHNSIKWKIVHDQEGSTFQSSLNSWIQRGYQVHQIETYAFDDMGSILYASIFYEKRYWPDGTRFEIAFGVPKDDKYCCDSYSRWTRLSNAGFKPLSLTVTQSPSSKRLFVADVWNDVNVGIWQGGWDKTAVQLQQTFASLTEVSPVYIKAYRVVDAYGPKVLFAYLAVNKDAPPLTLTTDVSNTAFAALARLIPKPPVAFTSYAFDEEIDAQLPGYGGMYTALWDGVKTNY